MNIESAILGVLSWKSLSGYDLKKIFEQSSIMYWSGNNNQIYKALTNLHKNGLATTEIQYQESSPSRKIYSITEKGLEALKAAILDTPNEPEYRKTFLMQLAWADLISDKELIELLLSYKEKINNMLIIESEKKRRGNHIPNRSKRENFLWDKIYENVFSSLSNELNWIDSVLKELSVL